MPLRLLVALVVAGLLGAGLPAAAAGRSAVTYTAPVPGPVIRSFSAPDSPYGAGKRGVDYGTSPGEVVRAAAPGEITFAGRVGDGLHAVVLHADGLRTSYSFLDAVSVRRGQRVAAGEEVGRAGESVHWGARAGEAYLDPLELLDGTARVHLIAEEDWRRQAEAEDVERAALARYLVPVSAARRAAGALGRAAVAAGGVAMRGGRAAMVAASRMPEAVLEAARAEVIAAFDNVRTVLALADLPLVLARSVDALVEDFVAIGAHALGIRGPCTGADEALPPQPAERRRVVLVGGLGSSSGKAAVLGVDTAGLGYAPEDVSQFSYRGGTAAENPYTATDTVEDLRESGRRLRALLERMETEEPGVPVDVIAHSQGGVVVREALATRIDADDGRAAPVRHVITLGTPHRGTDLATMSALLRHSAGGRTLRRGVDTFAGHMGLQPDARSIRQMAETSDFIRELNRRPLPEGVRLTSIAARTDVVVPTPRSQVRGARNVIVTTPLLGNAHDGLPRSEAAHREMALAMAGRPPTCESLGDVAADAFAGHLISAAEKGAGIAVFSASRSAVPFPFP